MFPLVAGGILVLLWWASHKAGIPPTTSATQNRQSTASSSVAPVSSPKILAAAPATFVPFQFTNRVSGPLIGPAGQIISSSPGGTSEALGQAKQGLGYAGQAAQAAQLVGVQVIAGVGTVIGAVVGALGLAQGLTAEAKTGLAEQAKESTILTSSYALVQTAAVAAAAAVSAAAGLLTAGLLLPIAAFFTASSINDANNAKVRAKKEVHDYKACISELKDWTPIVVSMSDRLDEAYLLPRVPAAQWSQWLVDNYRLAVNGLNTAVNFAPCWDHLTNGEHMVGIPGRDVSVIRGMWGRATNDGVLLYLFCRDALARLSIGIPSDVTLHAAYSPLNGVGANMAGFARDAWPGVVPGAVVYGTPPPELSDREQLIQTYQTNPLYQAVLSQQGATPDQALAAVAAAEEAFTSGGG